MFSFELTNFFKSSKKWFENCPDRATTHKKPLAKAKGFVVIAAKGW